MCCCLTPVGFNRINLRKFSLVSLWDFGKTSVLILTSSASVNCVCGHKDDWETLSEIELILDSALSLNAVRVLLLVYAVF